ncbi:MAG: hypothetical protein Hyperionvirus7_60 [Hyperionvirus sp.]|uniref:Uncharacterized protein n=1 Tax=Hyperionvirus sp. TaxID=2487770 RepID=A0A3G5ADP1_9VIRU|nr:MAG: hypothetical protein Hyperionvirus7_60 [Hyperionvirus sp.]
MASSTMRELFKRLERAELQLKFARDNEMSLRHKLYLLNEKFREIMSQNPSGNLKQIRIDLIEGIDRAEEIEANSKKAVKEIQDLLVTRTYAYCEDCVIDDEFLDDLRDEQLWYLIFKISGEFLPDDITMNAPRRFREMYIKRNCCKYCKVVSHKTEGCVKHVVHRIERSERSSCFEERNVHDYLKSHLHDEAHDKVTSIISRLVKN